MKYAINFLGVLTIVATAVAFFFLGSKANANCEATLVLTRSLENAVYEDAPNKTEAELDRARRFFDDVYSKLDC